MLDINYDSLVLVDVMGRTADHLGDGCLWQREFVVDRGRAASAFVVGHFETLFRYMLCHLRSWRRKGKKESIFCFALAAHIQPTASVSFLGLQTLQPSQHAY